MDLIECLREVYQDEGTGKHRGPGQYPDPVHPSIPSRWLLPANHCRSPEAKPARLDGVYWHLSPSPMKKIHYPSHPITPTRLLLPLGIGLILCLFGDATLVCLSGLQGVDFNDLLC